MVLCEYFERQDVILYMAIYTAITLRISFKYKKSDKKINGLKS
jgi:hypothetical protein